jgi:2-keto-4-pentenoate hydratase/2-oxohepta-3-ene-1,7-dioic acid hydratase in catechol pathway
LQCGATDLMIMPVPKLIAYISTILPLLPGDLIASGTAGGVGAKRNPPFWLKPGDVAEVEIGCIGILRNTVEAEA